MLFRSGFNGQVAFQQVRFVYTNPAEQTPPAIGDNARNNAPIDTIIYPNYKEYPDGGYPAGSVRYANAQDYVILPYGTFTWGGYDTASSVTITNPVVFPSDVNYVYWTQTATITYIDDTTGKVLHTDNINGQINSTSKYSPNSDQYSGSSTIGYDNPRTTKTIGDYEKEGYVLVSTNFPTNGVVFNTPNTPQSYEIHFVEGAQEITPNTPAGQVPTDTPDDAQPSALSKDVTLKVNYVNSDGTKFTGPIPSNADQSVNFTGTAYVSKVTGQLVNTKEENGQLVVDSSNTNTPEITWTPSTGSFNEVVSPVEKGYYLKSISSNQNGNNVGPITGLTHNSNDMTVTVTYAPLGHIIPVGPDNQPIPDAPQPQFPNNPDNPAEGNPGNKPDVPNWTPTEPGTTVSPNPNDPGANVNVPYTQDQGSITVTVHDVTDNVNLPQYGKSSGEQDVGTGFTYDKNTVITDLENKGYKVLNPDVVIPTTISKGAQNIVINVEHELVPVTPENPGTPGQPINPNDPDGPKWPDGTAKNDLEVTGTQTIHYEGAGDKTPADNTQHFTFTKSATVDKVTGKIVSETGWNVASHTFGNVDTPVVPGYHADKAVAGGATITPDDLNKTIVVTYAPNGHVIPVGPDGTPIPGADQPQFPTNPDNPTGTTPSEVPVVPGYHPETGKPGDPVDPVPGKPGENVPVKYVPDNPTPETYTGSQTIKFVDGTTGKEIETPNVQTAPDLTGDHTFGKINTPVIKGYTTTQTTAGGATVTKTDPNATITVTYTPNGHIIPVGPDGTPIPGADQPQFPTNPDNPSETTPGQVPDVPGYHPETGKPVEPVNPVPGKPGEDVPVKYVPDTPVEQGSITVTVRDTTDNVDLPQYGKSSGEENVGTTFTYDKNTVIQELENKGYKVLNPDVVIPTTISKGAQNIVINIEHELVPVTPENPGTPGQPINPNDPNGPKWPDGTAKNDLEATGTQTIRYVGAGDQTPANNVQHFTFTKSAVVDKVTGKIVSETGWNVASHTFGNINTPVVPGYHADKAVAGGTTITPDDLNKTVTVTYTPNGHIIPVGPDGKPLPNVPQPQYPTNPNNPTEVTPNEPVSEIPGYKPNVSTVTPENPGENTPVVYTPNEKTVEPTTPSENGTPNGNTGNPTTPQPETPAKPTTPTTTPAGNGNIPTNGQTTSPAGSSVTTSNVNNANATTPVAQKQAAQLPQTGNEQLKHEGILGLLALGVAGLLAFGKKRRKE